jgi:hypothetical protein
MSCLDTPESAERCNREKSAVFIQCSLLVTLSGPQEINHTTGTRLLTPASFEEVL